MESKEALNRIKNDINHASYGQASFRWKTPNTFIFNGETYTLNDKEAQELRNDVGKFIKIYLDAKKEKK